MCHCSDTTTVWGDIARMTLVMTLPRSDMYVQMTLPRGDTVLVHGTVYMIRRYVGDCVLRGTGWFNVSYVCILMTEVTTCH